MDEERADLRPWGNMIEQDVAEGGDSNRLERVTRAFGRAEKTLGSREKASRWMRTSNRALGGKRPLDLLESENDAREVDRILGRIDHGVYS